MNVLLLSMPDSFEHMPALAIRMPNGALASLAGNVDADHHVAAADLILVQDSVAPTVQRLMRDLRPQVVGLSVMTFQRRTASAIIRLVRSIDPGVRVVVGGYDPSLAPEAYTDEHSGVEFIVRGEGDLTFRDLLRALTHGESFDRVPGLTYRSHGRYIDNPPRAISSLESGVVKPPNRSSRVLTGYAMLGRGVDVVETSRGCTYDCSFCSIIEMRGRNFHTFDFDRVIADIRDARTHGARSIFLVDDNITLNVRRFEGLCRAIIAAGLDDIDYTVQAMTSAIASAGETLAPLMRQAGFRYVFLGIENIVSDDLAFLRAAAKNARRERGRNEGNATIRAIELLHRHGMYVVGGLIVGNPNDTPETIEANLTFARKYVDWPYIQHPTPYPGTPMTADLRADGLIVNDCVEEYDGTTAVVRSRHVAADEIEFMRWRAERWMKVRHIPATIRHDPAFVLRHGRRMLAHTFRGATWKTWLGLESPRAAFERYRDIRRREREYLPDVQPPIETSRRLNDPGDRSHCTPR